MTDTCSHATLSPVRDGEPLPESTIRYRSRGVVLVVGDDAGAVDVAKRLPSTLRAVVFAPGASGDLKASPRVVGGRVTQVEGHLGAFRARALTASGEADIGAFSHNEDGTFDLVLDVRAAPLIARSVPPPGYFAPGSAARVSRAALDSLGQLVGTFAKPRHFSYDASICAHGARGVTGCTMCLTACGAAAIRSAGEEVAVDANLCQGCASCALACPTGALSFARPSRAGTLAMLDAAVRSGAERFPAFTLVVHDASGRDAVMAAAAGKPWALMEIDPLPAFGEELWLAALALGVRRVVLVAGSTLPPESAAILASRLGAVAEVLGPSRKGRVLRVAPGELASLPGEPEAMALAAGPVRLDPGSKRGLLHDALARIGPEPKALAKGATLGTVRIDPAKCTLCSGCANICPTGALRFASVPVAELAFVEEACIQCGMCERACPEDAISLEARWADATMRTRPRALVTDEPARCPGCGAAFASRKLLEASLARFGPELGLEGEDLDRLRLCPACRQESMFRQS
jgi:ferredoxin